MDYLLAVGLPFIITMLIGPLLIRALKRLSFGQHIRGQGPDSHQEKEGVPTMGGVLILFSIVISAFFIYDLNDKTLSVLVVTLAMGCIGFLDDYLKIRSGSSLGLRAREKITGQLMTGITLALYVYYYTDIGSGIIIPVTGDTLILGKGIIPLIVLTVMGTANAVNLTDGLDGLAAGITAVVAGAFAAITSAFVFTDLTLLALTITGACVGFVWYNSHPAQVFMGDIGSLALGGAIATLAVLTRTEVFLLIIGGVYVLETLSVIIQVIYFKITGGKRVFRMTPLHHHYELAGLSESKIVARFFIMSILFASLGLISFYTAI